MNNIINTQKCPFFSVIIPVYNLEGYIKNCIESISRQKFDDYETIFIDDGSTDKSGIICDELSYKDRRFSVIHKKNGGVSSARNMGLDAANGAYVVFIDGDDYVKEDYLSNFFEMITSDADTDMAICGVDINGRNQVLNGNSEYDGRLSRSQVLQHMFRRDSVSGYLFNKAYKKEIIDCFQIRFREGIHICEDLLFNTEFVLKASGFAFNNSPDYVYVQRYNSAVHASFNIRHYSVISAYDMIIALSKDVVDEKTLNVIYGNLLGHFSEIYLKTIHHMSDEIKEIHSNVGAGVKEYYQYYRTNRFESKMKVKIILAHLFANFCERKKTHDETQDKSKT
jgi:Glycosyltransferases involved in cell wall biogenesis